MAKFELKFLDCTDESTISVTRENPENDFIRKNIPEGIIYIVICDIYSGSSAIYLDKSTAIKFAKTLRTEINKITSLEVENG